MRKPPTTLRAVHQVVMVCLLSLASASVTWAQTEPTPQQTPTPQESQVPIPLDPPPHFEPVPSRWDIDPTTLLNPGYVVNRSSSPLDPYNLNQLKGDFPILGEDIFLALEIESFTLAEVRNVPTPSGITGNTPNNADFFGDGDQTFLTNITAFEFDLFKGKSAFKPVDWRFSAVVALNATSLDVNEVGVVNINPSDGTDRLTGDLALQAAFFEVHLIDWNDRYDFASLEVGIIEFRSDFRGFIFDDVQLGIRFFGNADDNKWQYNLAFFHLLEKDANSELNTFQERNQNVLVANLYRFDFPFKGLNQTVSFHWNRDEASTFFNENDFLVRPVPIGQAKPHEVETYYLGWAVDGHWNRLNITGALYHVWGKDTDNPISGRSLDINAQLAALELSIDFDWARLKVYGFWASGDESPRDGSGGGFDAIVDSPNFAGGEFSYWNRQGIPLFGTFLTNRLSPLADLQASKFQGQSNFVNPGILIVGVGTDLTLTPTLRATAALNYLRFSDTATLETLVELEDIDQDIGVEALIGVEYRPLLTNNVIVTVGGSVLRPGAGLRKIYESDDYLWHAFIELTLTW